MRRDWNFIRQILLSIEEHGEWKVTAETRLPRECEEPQLLSPETAYREHEQMLLNAGWLEFNPDGLKPTLSITWNGRDFLDAARHAEVWAGVQSLVLSSTASSQMSIPSELLMEFLFKFNRQRLESEVQHTG